MNFKYVYILVLLVMSIQVEATTKTNNWSSRVGFGFNLSRANSDSTQFNGSFSLKHKTKYHEFLHALNAVYTETDGATSENNINALLQCNKTIAIDSYLYGNSTFRYDDIANIDYRVLFGVGLGHYLVQHNRLLVSVETGPSYLTEKLNTVSSILDAENYNENNNEFMWRFLQRYEQKLGVSSMVWEFSEYLVSVGGINRYLFNVEAGLDVPINSRFDLRFSVVNKYDSQPAPDTVANDLSMRVALVCRLFGE